MTPEDNKITIRAFMAAQTAEDLEKQRQFLDDDVTLFIPASGTRIVGSQSEIKGADNYISMRRGALAKLYRPGTRKVTIKHFMADADLVAVFYKMESQLARGGDYENDYVFLYRLRNGKIIEITEYVDTANTFLQLGFKISES